MEGLEKEERKQNFTPFSNLFLLKAKPEDVPKNPKATLFTPEFLRYLMARYEAQGEDPKQITLKQALEDIAALIGKAKKTG